MAFQASDVIAAAHIELGDKSVDDVSATASALDSSIITQIRLNIADSVETYRWSNNEIMQYAYDILQEIKSLRSDLAAVTNAINTSTSTYSVTTNMPYRFRQAIVAGVAYRCFSNDAEDSMDTERRNYFEKEYASAVNGVTYRYPQTMLEGFIIEGVAEITRKRPDVELIDYSTGYDNVTVGNDTVTYIHLPDTLKQSLIDYVVARCLTITMQNNLDVNKQQLYYYNRYVAETYGGGQ